MTALAVFLQTPMDDQGQFILTYNALLDDFPDLTPDVVKRVISARSDCDKDALQDVIAACRGILPSEQKVLGRLCAHVVVQALTVAHTTSDVYSVLLSRYGSEEVNGS